jgi:hypothetical protein
VDLNAGGGCGNEDDGLLAVLCWVCGIGLGHDDVDLAAWVASSGRPPFLTRVS